MLTNLIFSGLILPLSIIHLALAKDFSGIRAKRLIGGEQAAEHEFPFLVSIFLKDSFHCGGTIINKNTVLTAAHCLHFNNSLIREENFAVVAGDHDLNKNEHSEQRLRPKKFIVHPNYFNESDSIKNDIALIHFKEEFTFGEYVSSVLFNETRTTYEVGESGVLPGWGKTRENETNPSPVLMKAELVFVKESVCKNKYKKYGYSQENQFCAGSKDADFCTMDSGSPFLVKVGSESILYGIVSYNTKCGHEDNFGSVFTKVSFYSKWISDNIGKEEGGVGIALRIGIIASVLAVCGSVAGGVFVYRKQKYGKVPRVDPMENRL